jgi:PTS system mannose-specific IIA component
MASHMVGAVVVAHGRLGEAMVQVVEHMFHTRQGIEAVSTTPDDRREDIRSRIAAAVHRVDGGQGVLILTDMLGDTQTNLSVEIARETGAEVLAGINVPILVKMMDARAAMDAPRLAAFLRAYGKEHIFWPTQPRELPGSTAP